MRLARLVMWAKSPALLVKRIKNEEAVLLEQLHSYGEYMKKVRWQMIPFLW